MNSHVIISKNKNNYRENSGKLSSFKIAQSMKINQFYSELLK